MRRETLCRFYLACLLTAALQVSSTTLNAADKSDAVTAKIEEMIKDIKADNSWHRMEQAQRLMGFLLQQDQSVVQSLDDEAIDDIAALLSDDDDGVRLWAAGALGLIGPRAKRAIPALERALKNAELPPGAAVTGVWSGSAIQIALNRITGSHGCWPAVFSPCPPDPPIPWKAPQ
jgi:hypothetical protein